MYLGISGFCLLLSTVYTHYGHGVTSASMTWLALYPLLGGSLAFLLVGLWVPAAEGVPRRRLWFNLYNSGLVTLILGSALRGVFEIAGTASPYTGVYFLTGWGMAAAGTLGFWVNLGKQRKRARAAGLWKAQNGTKTGL